MSFSKTSCDVTGLSLQLAVYVELKLCSCWPGKRASPCGSFQHHGQLKSAFLFPEVGSGKKNWRQEQDLLLFEYFINLLGVVTFFINIHAKNMLKESILWLSCHQGASLSSLIPSLGLCVMVASVAPSASVDYFWISFPAASFERLLSGLWHIGVIPTVPYGDSLLGNLSLYLSLSLMVLIYKCKLSIHLYQPLSFPTSEAPLELDILTRTKN